MNRFLWFLRGFLALELTGASPQWALNNLANRSIPFWNVRWQDQFTVHICIPRKYQKDAEACISRAMCDCVSVDEMGFRQAAGGLLHRPMLILVMTLSLLILFVLPQFVLFYQVVGNETVSDEAIIRALDEIGVGFGIPGISIKPQWIKNHVLSMIPELEWITVTQNGCRAQVVVRERNHKPETMTRKGLANVIATQSGIITEQSVLAGQALFKVGDTVEKGDMLVSGLVDLERTYAIERADAEIYARTWRKQEVLTPAVCTGKQYTGETWKCVWLEIGEKRIKIYGNSGIYAVACDKMNKRTDLVLPGGLEIPASLIVETYCPYEPTEIQLSETDVCFRLQEYVRQSAREDMTAGEILAESWELKNEGGCYRLTGILECHEMIAASVEVQWDQGGIAHDGAIR